MAIQLLGFPTTLGLPRPARMHGPSALRQAGLIRALQHLCPDVADLGDLALSGGLKSDSRTERVAKVVAAARRQADTWAGRYKPGDLAITIGGDHSTSLGTIWALSRLGRPFDIVWIDAHGDFNTLETSPSGNPHGMVLALACGLAPEFAPALVAPSAVKIWGIRDVDPGERLLLEREGVEMAGPDQVRHNYRRLVNRLKPDILLSFDLDSVDPAEAPGAGVPVPNGFHRSEVLDLVGYISQHRRLLALDVVEFHPDLDRNHLTGQLALDVIQTAVSGQTVHLRNLA